MLGVILYYKNITFINGCYLGWSIDFSLNTQAIKREICIMDKNKILLFEE